MRIVACVVEAEKDLQYFKAYLHMGNRAVARMNQKRLHYCANKACAFSAIKSKRKVF